MISVENNFVATLLLNVIDKVILGGAIWLVATLVQDKAAETTRLQSYELSMAQIETQSVLTKIATMERCFSEASFFLTKFDITGLRLTAMEKQELYVSLGCIESQLTVVNGILDNSLNVQNSFTDLREEIIDQMNGSRKALEKVYTRFMTFYSSTLTNLNAKIRELAREEFFGQ